jgi:hypothetical protein
MEQRKLMQKGNENIQIISSLWQSFSSMGALVRSTEETLSVTLVMHYSPNDTEQNSLMETPGLIERYGQTDTAD